MRGWLWALLLLVAAAWIFGVPSTAPLRAGGAAGKPPYASAAVNRGARSVSAYAVLHARDLSLALADFSAVAPEPELRRLRSEVDAACRVLTLLELDGRSEPDVRREQARGELARRCAGLPVPSMFVPVADTRLPFDDELEPGAGAAALADLRRASHPEQLIQTWLEAYRQDALPQDQIFPDRRRLLPAEAESLIRVVVDWRECERLNACDADGLFALRVCALHGCVPGSDLRSAWHQALSPRDFESVLAIHAWLQRWQLGSGS